MNLLAQEMGAFIIKKIIMNKTMTYIASLLLCIGSVSCGNNTKQQSQNTAEEQAIVSTGMEVDSLLANADSLAEKNITVQGICTHTCKHGAKKIFLMGSDDTQTIRIEAGELGQFSPDCVNSIVEVNGILKEQRIDENYLVQWEEQAKAKTEENEKSEAADGEQTEMTLEDAMNEGGSPKASVEGTEESAQSTGTEEPSLPEEADTSAEDDVHNDL